MSGIKDMLALLGAGRPVTSGKTGSCVALMKEFFRREARWAGELGLTAEVPFAGLAIAIDPTVNQADKYAEGIKSFARSMVEHQCLVAMLNWYTLLQHKPEVLEAHSLPDPYLPMLLFFKRGGRFTREHRIYFEVNGEAGIVSSNVQNADPSGPPLDLSDDFLDGLDRDGL